MSSLRKAEPASLAGRPVWLRGIVPLRTAAREYREYARSIHANPDALREVTEAVAIRSFVRAWEDDPMAHEYEVVGPDRAGYLVPPELSEVDDYLDWAIEQLPMRRFA